MITIVLLLSIGFVLSVFIGYLIVSRTRYLYRADMILTIIIYMMPVLLISLMCASPIETWILILITVSCITAIVALLGIMIRAMLLTRINREIESMMSIASLAVWRPNNLTNSELREKYKEKIWKRLREQT